MVYRCDLESPQQRGGLGVRLAVSSSPCPSNSDVTQTVEIFQSRNRKRGGVMIENEERP